MTPISQAGGIHFRKQYYSTNNAAQQPDPDGYTEEQKGTKESEIRIRRYKKIFSSILFAATLIAVAYARRRKRNELEENFRGCVRIPPDDAFKGSHKEFFRCGADAAAGKPGCVLPAQILKDGTIRAVKSFQIRPDDIIVASFPKTGKLGQKSLGCAHKRVRTVWLMSSNCECCVRHNLGSRNCIPSEK